MNELKFGVNEYTKRRFTNVHENNTYDIILGEITVIYISVEVIREWMKKYYPILI